MGSQDVLDRLRSEKKQSTGGSSGGGRLPTSFNRRERKRCCCPTGPPGPRPLLPEARGSGDFWYGTYQTPEVIAYNSALLNPDEAPGDWDDLLDPKWKREDHPQGPLGLRNHADHLLRHDPEGVGKNRIAGGRLPVAPAVWTPTPRTMSPT